MKLADLFYNALNWLTLHKLKYVSLFLYVALCCVILPPVLGLLILCWLFESVNGDKIIKNAKCIYKGEEI